eukprot:32064_1
MTYGSDLILTNIRFIAALLGGCTLTCSIIFLILLVDLCKSKEGLPLIRLYSIAGLALFTMSNIFCLAAFVMPIDGTLMEIVTLSLSDMSWSLATVLCYLLWIVRMKHCFLNTPYQPSSLTYKIMYIGIATFFIFQMTMDILLFLWESKVITYIFLDKYDIINIFVKSLIHTIVSVFLIYLFLSRLMKITVEVAEDDHDDISDFQSESLELTGLQKSLIHIITKYGVLFTSMIITTEFYILGDVILSIAYLLETGNDTSSTHETYHVKWIILGINCVIMSICILLSFEFSDRCYQRICKCCHLYCRRCFSSKAKRDISMYRLSKKHSYKEGVGESLSQPLMDNSYSDL